MLTHGSNNGFILFVRQVLCPLSCMQHAMQEREQAVSIYPFSQEQQRIASVHPLACNPAGLQRAGLPPRHSIAPSEQGASATDTASVTAAKLLDQIGHMAVLEEQVW